MQIQIFMKNQSQATAMQTEFQNINCYQIGSALPLPENLKQLRIQLSDFEPSDFINKAELSGSRSVEALQLCFINFQGTDEQKFATIVQLGNFYSESHVQIGTLIKGLGHPQNIQVYHNSKLELKRLRNKLGDQNMKYAEINTFKAPLTLKQGQILPENALQALTSVDNQLLSVELRSQNLKQCNTIEQYTEFPLLFQLNQSKIYGLM